MQEGGALGIAMFWLRVFAVCLSGASFVTSIVHLARASSKIWQRATGSSIVVTNAFIMVCSLAALAFKLLWWFGIALPAFRPLSPFQLFVVFALVAQFLYCALMSLTTNAATYDFCERNPGDPAVVEFRAEHPTQDLVEDYVAARTSWQYVAAAAFFAVWLPATVALAISKRKPDNRWKPRPVPADGLPVVPDDDGE
jgi:hypothetical protein